MAVPGDGSASLRALGDAVMRSEISDDTAANSPPTRIIGRVATVGKKTLTVLGETGRVHIAKEGDNDARVGDLICVLATPGGGANFAPVESPILQPGRDADTIFRCLVGCKIKPGAATAALRDWSASLGENLGPCVARWAANWCERGDATVLSMGGMALSNEEMRRFLGAWYCATALRRWSLLGVAPDNALVPATAALAIRAFENPYSVPLVPMAMADRIDRVLGLGLPNIARRAGELGRFLYTALNTRRTSVPTAELARRFPDLSGLLPHLESAGIETFEGALLLADVARIESAVAVELRMLLARGTLEIIAGPANSGKTARIPRLIEAALRRGERCFILSPSAAGAAALKARFRGLESQYGPNRVVIATVAAAIRHPPTGNPAALAVVDDAALLPTRDALTLSRAFLAGVTLLGDFDSKGPAIWGNFWAELAKIAARGGEPTPPVPITRLERRFGPDLSAILGPDRPSFAPLDTPADVLATISDPEQIVCIAQTPEDAAAFHKLASAKFSRGMPETKVGGRTWRVGDRALLSQPIANILRGSIGVVADITDAGVITVHFESGEICNFAKEATALLPAYGLQPRWVVGRKWPVVVIALSRPMSRRELVMVAGRATERVFLCGPAEYAPPDPDGGDTLAARYMQTGAQDEFSG